MKDALSIAFGIFLFLGGSMVVQDLSLAPVLAFQAGTMAGLLFMARATW